ncbi:MAG: M48 family metalloprotease [Myxococcota bacterium]
MIELLEFSCARCNAVNRLKFERILSLGTSPKCGGCHEPLLRMLNEPLTGLDPAAYTHPLDKEALAALQRIPGIKTMLKGLIKNSVELATRLNHHATFIKVTETQAPSLYKRFRTAGDRLGMAEVPDLFIFQNPLPNAYTFGVEKAFVAISTGALELLNEEEQLGVLGHELGHVHAHHVLYKTAARVFSSLAANVAGATLGIGGLLMYPIEMALRRWDRASELTADRAQMLVVRKPEVVITTLMKLAGGSRSVMNELSFKAFIEQAEHFEKLRDEGGLNKFFVAFDSLFKSHPFPVYRAKEALEFVSGGEFLEILDGDYPRQSLVNTSPCPRCGKPLVPGEIICPHCAYGAEEDLSDEQAKSLGQRLDKSWEEARDWFKRTFGGEGGGDGPQKPAA